MIKAILVLIVIVLICFAVGCAFISFIFNTTPYIPKLPSGYSMYVNEFDDYKFVAPNGYTSETYDKEMICINAAIAHYKVNYESNIVWKVVE